MTELETKLGELLYRKKCPFDTRDRRTGEILLPGYRLVTRTLIRRLIASQGYVVCEDSGALAQHITALLG